ncbi:MAG: hypothetical protein K2N78_07760, partial [Oscillospiraceae bacterium]|nr:hypothetical protein [Oscillospiraceae bacterium]
VRRGGKGPGMVINMQKLSLCKQISLRGAVQNLFHKFSLNMAKPAGPLANWRGGAVENSVENVYNLLY